MSTPTCRVPSASGSLSTAFPDFRRDRPVQGVAGLWLVDGNDLYRAAALDQYLVAHHASTLLGFTNTVR